MEGFRESGSTSVSVPARGRRRKQGLDVQHEPPSVSAISADRTLGFHIEPSMFLEKLASTSRARKDCRKGQKRQRGKKSALPKSFLTELLDLPQACLALVVSHLDSAGKLDLLRTGHTARRLVLSHTHRVSLMLPLLRSEGRLLPSACQLWLLARLLEVPHPVPFSLELSAPAPCQMQMAVAQHQCSTVNTGSPRRLVIRHSTIQTHHLLQALIPVYQHYTVVVLEDVWLGCAAFKSLGYLSTTRPHPLELEVRNTHAEPFAQLPGLRSCVTVIETSAEFRSVDQYGSSGWGRNLVESANSFKRLHTLRYTEGLPLNLLRALRACPALTHVSARSILPLDEEVVGGLDWLPPALQQLSLSHASPRDLCRLPWLPKVPALKLRALDCRPLKTESTEALLEQSRAAATLLVQLPHLLIGEQPDSDNAMQRSLWLDCLHGDELAVLEALQPLGHHLACLALTGTRLLPSHLAGMGAVLGKHTTTLCLVEYKVPVSSNCWEQLLAALPKLTCLSVDKDGGRGGLKLEGLAEACQAQQRHLELQVKKYQMPEETADALATGWLRVLRF